MEEDLFYTGQKIASYNELSLKLDQYEESTKYQFVISNSKSLVNVFKNAEVIDFNPELIYNEINMQCSINDGGDDEPVCPAELKVSLSPWKQNLKVRFCGEHNHDPPATFKQRTKGRYQILFEKAKKLKEDFEGAKQNNKQKSHFSQLILGLNKDLEVSTRTEKLEKLKKLKELLLKYSPLDNNDGECGEIIIDDELIAVTNERKEENNSINNKINMRSTSKINQINMKYEIRKKKAAEEVKKKNQETEKRIKEKKKRESNSNLDQKDLKVRKSGGKSENELLEILNIKDEDGKIKKGERQITLINLQQGNRENIKKKLTLDTLRRWHKLFDVNAIKYLELIIKSRLDN